MTDHRTRIELAPNAYEAQEYDLRTQERMADSFAKRSRELYDEMIIGEDKAKEMMSTILLTGAAGGMGGITMGPPGTGKSMMNEYGFSVVDGIAEQHVAAIPHRQDLTPTELMGKTSEMKRTSANAEGEVEEELITAHIVPIIKKGIQGLRSDETSRVGPYALNAILKVTQDGYAEFFENGILTKEELEFFLSSMNNYGTAFTNRLDPALINRHAMGVFMGDRPEGGLSEAAEEMWNNHTEIYRSKPASDTAISLGDLHQVRAVIPFVTIKNQEIETAKRLQVQTLNHLQGEGIEQGDPRHAGQLIRVAKTLTLLRNERSVTEDILRDTMTYSLIARLGMTGKITTNAEAEVIVSKFN